ncbi:UBP-type zinc finger domain-containing protein [Streptomyces sp. NPDC056361]|uniref:UBP-type zinc finger domain-containing protein n=1 Tax=Streptomyces sp. NPDC056361 TaxID=3345795 RepID=UPI0035DF807B
MSESNELWAVGLEASDEGVSIRTPPLKAWGVAPDGGRPQGSVCTHASMLPQLPSTMPSEVCAACLALGYDWVRLRWCTTCGNVGCCDSSQGQHAHAHHVTTGHPVVISLAPDESWAWCYVDDVFLIEI